MYVHDASSQWTLQPKQDHLVCFLGGLLMLGATTIGAVGHSVSIPPRYEELTPQGRRDWKTGVDLTQTCIETHNTATYVPMSSQVGNLLITHSLEVCHRK